MIFGGELEKTKGGIQREREREREKGISGKIMLLHNEI
jgi:hypothetical protein